MNPLKKAAILILVASFGALLGACSTNSPKKSSIPWSQPAGWEGQIPGMAPQTGR